jgi:hypothetical protein
MKHADKQCPLCNPIVHLHFHISPPIIPNQNQMDSHTFSVSSIRILSPQRFGLPIALKFVGIKLSMNSPFVLHAPRIVPSFIDRPDNAWWRVKTVVIHRKIFPAFCYFRITQQDVLSYMNATFWWWWLRQACQKVKYVQLSLCVSDKTKFQTVILYHLRDR